jgi:hypothetical protein
MMRVAIHQPNYFPWLGYFHKVRRVDVFVLLDNVDFQQGNSTSVTNRTTIKTSQGPQRITVPVLKAASSPLLRDIRIDQSQRWQKRHLGSLRAAYGRAPFFDEVFPLAESVLGAAGESLADLNRASIEAMCRFLELPTPLLYASTLGLSDDDRTGRLVEICRRVGGTVYLSGRGARRYNDAQRFQESGIALEYTAFECPPYPQLHGEFVPNLSLLDALFNCGREAQRLLA